MHGHLEQFEGSSAEDVANHGIGRQVKPSFQTTPGSFYLLKDIFSKSLGPRRGSTSLVYLGGP